MSAEASRGIGPRCLCYLRNGRLDVVVGGTLQGLRRGAETTYGTQLCASGSGLAVPSHSVTRKGCDSATDSTAGSVSRRRNSAIEISLENNWPENLLRNGT
jgi:hypothetical protein